MITKEERAYLLNEMKNLLKEYDYNYSDAALDDIVDTWESKKTLLIEAFKRHPNYVEGKFMIAFSSDYERIIDTSQIDSFSYYIRDVARKMVGSLPDDIDLKRIEDRTNFLPHAIWNLFENLSTISPTRTISEEVAILMNKFSENLHIHKGEKTSRAINKLCTYLGYNKDEEYNREFAKYADSLSPVVIKRHTVLSINPIDYLTMSFGNSWSSCHTIDKENKRGMPNSYSGCYSSGTMSYMLDESSMVFYIVDSSYDGTNYYLQPKVNRQMYHYSNEKLIQGRLYPQGNDGARDFYKQYREIVQEIIAKIFDLPNLWIAKHGASEIRNYVKDEGTHYKDYREFDSCTISLLKDSKNIEDVNIGSFPICIECGQRHERNDCISCCKGMVRCAHCGSVVEENEARIIDGQYYCGDCWFYCECCDEYHVGEGTYANGYGRVCEKCLKEYFMICESCGEYYHKSRIEQQDGRNICYRCQRKDLEYKDIIKLIFG